MLTTGIGNEIETRDPLQDKEKVIRNTRGQLISWNGQRGYGFARVSGIEGNVFVHAEQLCEHLRQFIRKYFEERTYGNNVNLQTGIIPLQGITIDTVVEIPDEFQKRRRAEGVRCAKYCDPNKPASAANTDKANEVIEPNPAIFTDEGKRWFRCGTDRSTTRMTSSEDKRYKAGEAIELQCGVCHGKGTVKK